MKELKSECFDLLKYGIGVDGEWALMRDRLEHWVAEAFPCGRHHHQVTGRVRIVHGLIIAQSATDFNIRVRKKSIELVAETVFTGTEQP